jgi:hypothetical protein
MRVAARQEHDIAGMERNRRPAGDVKDATSSGHEMKRNPTGRRLIMRRGPLGTELA